MLRRGIALLLCFAMLLPMLPVGTLAQEQEETEAVQITEAAEEMPSTEATEDTQPTEETENTELTQPSEPEETEPTVTEPEESVATEPEEPTEPEETENPEVIHEHDYEAVVTDPTCTEQGYTTYTCECGDSYESDYVDALGHTYKNGICTGCGEEDTDGLDLNGLNVLCLGDSITAGQGLTTETRWTNVLASKYGWNLTNKSQGGISLSSYYYTANGKSDVSIAKKAEILKTMTTKPDVIIVWGGHNDTSYRYSPLGTWDDETTDSFKGALKYIAELADEYAPDATLFVLTPLWTTEAPSTLKVPENTTDNNWMFVDAIYDGAEAYGWIPINMDLCGITPFTKSGLLLDNIHPNEAGTEKIVEYLSEELASYGANSKKQTILFNHSSVSIENGKTTTLKAVLSPRSGNGSPVFTWSSSNSSVATVDANGKITAVAHGNATIIATADNDVSATVQVYVAEGEHTYESTVTAPTCTEQGYTTYTCECGDSYVSDYVDATGEHSYENSICMGCGKSILCEAEFPVDLFVFAGQSNMMGAAVLEPEVDSFTDQAWEYKYMPKLRGAETGSFVPAQNSAGEWYYNDLNAAYGENLYDLTYQSSLSNYSENTYFCPAMSNGTKGFSAQSEANMYPSASLPPYFATEYASYGHSSIYAHMAKGSAKIIHYFTADMMNAYNAIITAYNAENNKSYKLLTAADLTGAGNAFDAKYAAMLEDYATYAPDGSINNKCFVWLQGESDGSSYIEYKLKMQVLWEHLQTIGFTHFFVLRVGYWGSTGILDIIKAQEDFCAENENCYIVTRAPSLIPHPSATTDNWWIIEPDAEYADCRDSYTVAGSSNHHFNEKAMQIFAERSADNIHRILYQGLDPILENENIQGMLAEDKPEVDQPEDTSLYSSYVGTEAFYKGLSISKSSDKWVEKSSSTAASTDLIPVASSDSVWIQYVFFLSEAHAVGGFYDKNGELVAPLYYRDFGFSLGGGGGTAAFRTPEATNRISIADIELVTGKEIAFVRFTAWQASAGGHANTEARVYHDYEAVVTTPTCTEQGYTTHICPCGDSYTDSYVDATGHTYENGTCTVCGQKQPKQLVKSFETVSSVQPGDARLADAFNTVAPLIYQDLTLFENCAITALNLFVTGTVVDNDSSNKNDPAIDDSTAYTFDISVIDASSVKAGRHYTIKETYTISVPGSQLKKNDWNTFDVSHLGITLEEGETLGFGSSTSTLEIFYLNKCVSTNLRYFGHKTTTGDTSLSLRTSYNLLVGVEGYSLLADTAPEETHVHNYVGGTCTGCGEAVPTLEGRTISILGASISTYQGASNGAAAETTNSTIANNVKYYPNTTIPEVTLNDTWWTQVANDLGLRLLVNNAWSGSAILLERSGTVGAYVDRCVQLHDDTGDNAGEVPDIICIQMGFNDFSYGKDTLGTADIDYDALITPDGYGNPVTTMEATAIMLDKMVKRYPNAEIYMFNHFKRIGQSASDTALMEQLNASIATVCARFGVTVVDLYSNLTDPAHIGDGRLHPNKLGMDVISEAVKRAITGNTVYVANTHTVSFDLDGVTADYGDDKIVTSGHSFTAALTAADALAVTVTMGGEDITASAYTNGTVAIDVVTADVTITAKSVHEPQDYRWAFDGSDLACVSGENTLTKNGGTTTDGVFSKTRYALEKAVVLSHDQPWEVEWKCEGTFLNANGSSGARIFTSDDVNANYNARYIFKSNTNGIIAMGEKTTTGSHNYGIALADHGIDWTQLHTYRLENRIAEDGTNMVYLFVDGTEIGPMVNYYVGTTDKKTTSDWLSGKDFLFPYMGTDTHGFTNCSIEYIAVWEGGHTHTYGSVVTAPTCTEKGYTTYTCDCGVSFVDDYVDATGHTYENGTCTVCGDSLAGKTISILGDSISTFAGVSNNASYNSTIGSNAVYYSGSTLGVSRADTWWQQTIDALGMELLVNNSWSGSCIFPKRSNTEGAYKTRCVNLHNDSTGEEPDIIAVFLGTNDFSYYQSILGTADIDYDALIADNGDGTYTYAAPATSCEAYAIMLHKMVMRYPNAEIFCMTLTARRDPDKEDSYADVGQPTAFNESLTQIITHFGCNVVDLETCGIEKDAEVFDRYMGDQRVHPNAAGMDKITEALLSTMVGKETAMYNVSYGLENVLADTDRGAVLSGGTFSAKLTLPEGCDSLTVQVSMGGTDITASTCSDGIISIPAVTGDVVITASAVKAPASYRWEFDGRDMVSVGEDENVLTRKAGTVTDGTLMDVYYSLAEEVQLRHDRPWSVAFRASGAWSGMILSTEKTAAASGNTYLFKTTSASGFIGFGERVGSQYRNYGIALGNLGVDTTAEHVYLLENRIAEDGSNMVYLYVDGVEYGAMNNYFIGGTDDQGTTVNWLNGKNLSFSYIGASGHAMNNCALDHIAVWEGGHTHTYGSVVTAPTCTEKGYTTYTCTICGDSYIDSYVDANGHTEVIDAKVEPTCTATGLTEGKHCSACGEILTKQDVLPAKGHNFGNWTVTKNPTCTAAGEERRDCSNCDHFETREVKANGHTEVVDKRVEPTCTATGLTEGKHCSVCSEVLTAQTVIPAKGHSFGNWTVTKNPTCTETGEERRDCSNCDHFETRSITANGHTEVIDKRVEPTCTATGLTEGKHCSVCGEVLTAQTVIPANGHSFGSWTVTKNPTCTETGEERRDCTNCDHFETREVKATGHTEVVDARVEPTCTATGLTEGKHCSVCGEVLTAQTVIPANGHSFGAWTVTKDPTCTETGEERRDCTNCDHFETRSITATGHTEVIDKRVEPTCTATGLTEGKHCSVCGEVLTAQTVIPAKGHSFGSWTVTKNPTCTETGEKQRDCQNCETSETREIPLIPTIAMIGDARFASIEDALETAAAGDTVLLKADAVVEPYLILPVGVSLDLDEYDLTTGYVFGSRESVILATPNAGRLIVPEGNLILSQAYLNEKGQSILPVWDPANESYVFSLFMANTGSNVRGLRIDSEAETIYFQWKHQATGAINQSLIADNGCSDNEISMIVRLEWTDGDGIAYQNYVYKDAFVQNATGTYDYTLKMTGYKTLGIDLSTLAVTAMIVTESGATVYGTRWTIENAK